MSDSWIGKIVGNCRIDLKIGEGGCGQVFRGVDLMLERPVAIKVMHGRLASRTDIAERFRTEAHTLARLSHPNIATLYSFHREADTYLMVMEFVEGKTFDELIVASGGLAPAQAMPLFCQALDGIHYAHQSSVIHRDLKGSNLMENEAGRVKVMDFGIARALWVPGITQGDHPVGTPEYMSPEQVRAEEIDARADVYSLGVLLFKMLTGKLPFRGDNPYDIMRAQVEQVPPSIRDFVPGIPASIDEAIQTALAKQADDRFQSAGEFREALEEAFPKEGWEEASAQAGTPVALRSTRCSPEPHAATASHGPRTLLERHEGPTQVVPPAKPGAAEVGHTILLLDLASSSRWKPILTVPGLAGLALVVLLTAGTAWLAVSSPEKGSPREASATATSPSVPESGPLAASAAGTETEPDTRSSRPQALPAAKPAPRSSRSRVSASGGKRNPPSQDGWVIRRE